MGSWKEQLLSRRAIVRALPSLALVAAILWLLSKTLPREPRQPFVLTTLWSFVIATSFVGWGSLVALIVGSRAQAKERIDLGLRMAWGAGAMALVAGFLLVPSLMNRTVAMLMVEGGVLLAIAALVREREDVWRRGRFVLRWARREPRVAVVGLIVFVLLAAQYLGSIAEWHTDPYDDDIAYLTFVRKLLDTGSFPEPFSFRRLSALGSQTFFASLVSMRATPAHAHTFDRAICVLMVTLLVLGHRSRGRRPSALFTIATVLIVPLLPVVTRNTASHYSAIAFFVALFRTMVWAGERESRAPWRTALPIALMSMVVCTLRQNYVPIAVFFLAMSYGGRWIAMRPFDKSALRAGLFEPLLVAVMTSVALAPWMVSAYQSNQTILYPLMNGTYNKALQLGSDAVTAAHDLRLAIWTMLEGVPLYTVGIFLLAAMLSREPRSAVDEKTESRRPLFAFVIASLVGYALLIHALSLGDPGNLGRYALGFVVAAAIATSLTTGLTRYRANVSGRRAQIAASLALLALLLQIGRSADGSYKFFGRALKNIDEARIQAPTSRETERLEEETYAKLQLAIPQGERLAVLVDEPHYFDFRRNPIWNLDMPGYSSLPPGMPFFLGSAKLEEYFKTVGIRYLAFVRSDQSRYQYRREYWVTLLADEMEIWRTYAPYVIDFTDNLLDIATRHRHLYEKDGMVLLDLAEPISP